MAREMPPICELPSRPEPPAAPSPAPRPKPDKCFKSVKAPSDDAWWNIGCPDPDNPRLADFGITGSTKTHAHIWAYDSTSTFLGLGTVTKATGLPFDAKEPGYLLSTAGTSTTLVKLDIIADSQDGNVVTRALHGRVATTAHEDIALKSEHKAIEMSAKTRIHGVAGEKFWMYVGPGAAQLEMKSDGADNSIVLEVGDCVLEMRPGLLRLSNGAGADISLVGPLIVVNAGIHIDVKAGAMQTFRSGGAISGTAPKIFWNG